MKKLIELLTSSKILGIFSRSSDVVLAAFIIIIIGMIIVPVPPTVIDIMIATCS